MAQITEADILQQSGINTGDNSQLRPVEVIAGKFGATEYVTIKNILKEELAYAYADPAEEKADHPDRMTQIVHRAQPKVRRIAPNKSITIAGWEAYIALDRMYKAFCQSKVGIKDKDLGKDTRLISSLIQDNGNLNSFLDNAIVRKVNITDTFDDDGTKPKGEDLGL